MSLVLPRRSQPHRTTGGVSLGLVLARRIVEARGGTIAFHSEPDVGSRFWFVLQATS